MLYETEGSFSVYPCLKVETVTEIPSQSLGTPKSEYVKRSSEGRLTLVAPSKFIIKSG